MKHLLLIVLLFPLAASAFGPGCYPVKSQPTTHDELRLVREKGWQELAYADRPAVSVLIGQGKAELLVIPDARICGDPLDGMQIFNSTYWRRKK